MTHIVSLYQPTHPLISVPRAYLPDTHSTQTHTHSLTSDVRLLDGLGAGRGDAGVPRLPQHRVGLLAVEAGGEDLPFPHLALEVARHALCGGGREPAAAAAAAAARRGSAER